MTQGRKFQFELADTMGAVADGAQMFCTRCVNKITILQDPEHVIISSALRADTWRMHVDCFGEFLEGAQEFNRIFIIEKQKIVQEEPT